MKMEALAYLARSDSSDDDDDFDSSDGRPTPLDPEYWRGITHSREVVPAPTAAAYRQPSRMDPPAPHHHHYDPYGAASYPMYHQQQYPYQRPATSPSAVMHGHGHYGAGPGGGVLMSPIHYQSGGPPMIPISPVAHMDAMHDATFMPQHSGVGMAHGLHRPGQWSDPVPRSYSPAASVAAVSPVSTPQQLKQQVREALVRAQAYLDLGPFFQCYDMSYTGGIRLGSIQEALARVGVILRDHVLQSIGQLFSIPGSGLIDYMSLSRFLELDAQEL